MGAGRWIGRGEKESADQAAVDPLEGTRLTALGQPNAIAVIALAERGTLFFPGAAVYMNKIAVGPESVEAIDIDAPPAENVRRVAEAKGVRPQDVSIVVLDRPRHEELIAELSELGARVMLIPDGDVAPAIAAAQPGTGVDMLMGVGGTPEGVIAACAVKSFGGALQGKLWPRDDEERQQLVDGDDLFVAATGVTSGALLRGVRYTKEGAVTDSLVIRSRSGTVRRIEAHHAFEKLSRFTGREY